MNDWNSVKMRYPIKSNERSWIIDQREGRMTIERRRIETQRRKRSLADVQSLRRNWKRNNWVT